MVGMGEKVVWLAGALLVYVIFCLACTWIGVRKSKGTRDVPVSSLALTGGALTGWMFTGHIGLIYRDGLPYGSLSLAVIVLPLMALVFFARINRAARAHEAETFPQLLGLHFQSKPLQLLAALVGLAFAILALAAFTRAGGSLLNLLSDDAISVNHGMIGLTALIFLYAGLGGKRGMLAAARVQFILFLLAIILCGAIAVYYLGSFERLQFGLSELARLDESRNPSGDSHYFAHPGMIQLFGSAREAVGSPWTGLLAATSLLAFAGIFTSPVFLNWAIASPDAGRLARRQIWTAGLLLGLLLISAATLTGLSGHVLGANMIMTESSQDAVYNIMGANLGGTDLMETFGQQDELVPILISLTADTLPWLFGILAMCALAAVQCTSGALLQGAVSIAVADLMPSSLPRGRATHAVAALAICAVVVALAWGDESTAGQYTQLALAWSLQLLPALIAICFISAFTATGVFAGLIAGLIAALLTDEAGVTLLGLQAWGGWPLTIHAAFWGLLANFGTAILVSAFTPNTRDTLHVEGLGRPAVWSSAVLWIVFAAGPGAIIGNSIFSSPGDAAGWIFGIPSLWAWQILFWALGVGLLLFVAGQKDQASQM